MKGEVFPMNPKLSRSLTLVLLLAICASLAPGKPAAEELSLVVTIVTGERGRDSHSTTTTLTLSGDKLTYHQSYHGAHAAGQTPVKKEYKLSAADRDELVKALREKNLLVTRTLKALSQDHEPGSYFSLLIRSTLAGREHSTTITLPRAATKVKGERLYQDSVALVEQIYRIIKRTDRAISMPELIP